MSIVASPPHVDGGEIRRRGGVLRGLGSYPDGATAPYIFVRLG
jgi:hypothetical protein